MLGHAIAERDGQLDRVDDFFFSDFGIRSRTRIGEAEVGKCDKDCGGKIDIQVSQIDKSLKSSFQRRKNVRKKI